MYNITIFTEAGKTIGFGHYTRCSSLYQVLSKADHQVRFIVYECEYTINDPNIESLNWLKSIDSHSPIERADIAIIDSYLADESRYTEIAEQFNKVIAIDDYNRISYPVDLVINPNVFFDNIDYSNQTAICIGGKDYVILRSEFTQVDQTVAVNEIVQNILITIGGSDFRNLLPKLISCCMQYNEINITVIDPEKKINDQQNVRVLPAQSAAQMVHEMQQADIVISACGQTLHELASLKKPTIGICLDIDQEPNQAYYFEKGFLGEKLQWNINDLEQKIAAELQHLMSFETRKRRQYVAQQLINKYGVNNILKFIDSLYDFNRK